MFNLFKKKKNKQNTDKTPFWRSCLPKKDESSLSEVNTSSEVSSTDTEETSKEKPKSWQGMEVTIPTRSRNSRYILDELETPRSPLPAQESPLHKSLNT